MSQNGETNGHDPFSPCKPFIFLADKPSEFFRRFAKGTVGFLLSISFLFVLYSIISGQYRGTCTQCFQVVRNSAGNFVDLAPAPSENSPVVKTNISHILFGIGGSVKTWPKRRTYSELWWRRGETRGFVWLDEKPPVNEPWPAESPPYRVSEDSSRFKYTSSYGSRSAVRIARIVLESVRLKMENVRWYVMGDDDTVFFPDNLVTVLSKYDHEERYYIGGISESVEQDVIHQYGMAYGGGGFAISHRLAEELARILDGCLDRYANFYGSDQRVHACLTEFGVPLTRELGFHQLDLSGDAYGFLAAHPVAPLVSLHHLDYVKPIVPSLTQIGGIRTVVAASSFDQGRTLQQSFCYDLRRNWSVSVSWGYTAQVYPRIVMAKDLAKPFQTFKTWRTRKKEPFTFNTRPWRDEKCEQPLIYFLVSVMEGKNGITVTTYTRNAENPGKECNRRDYAMALKVDAVKVFAPKMDPDDWSKAPRRQCCDVDGHSGRKSIHMRIRKCKPGESLSPP